MSQDVNEILAQESPPIMEVGGILRGVGFLISMDFWIHPAVSGSTMVYNLPDIG